MNILTELFKSYAGACPERMEPLSGSGSNRRYFRIFGGGRSALGVIGTCAEENRAFIGMSRHFLEKGIAVPEVYAVSGDGMSYLQEDLGDGQLYSLVSGGRGKGCYSEEEKKLLLETVERLPDIQYLGAEGMDWSLCWPEKEFSRRTVLFDLNYFKYCFLKPSGLEFNEFALQDDFEAMADDLVQCGGDKFMYRDFQARNVMFKDGKPYFIDFQGGRKGPVWYDLASFVWQARARYPEELKRELVDAYISSMKKYEGHPDEELFRSRLSMFVLFRTLQVLGAYGFRGKIEKKPHFMESIPFAVENLRSLLGTSSGRYPYLYKVLRALTELPEYSPQTSAEEEGLVVRVNSFSFKKGIPADGSGNGGGYVFDCRALNNPGRYERYRKMNGTDAEVIAFLEEDGGVFPFMENVYALVDEHVGRFLERKFTSLQVNFGCTGGQHRSVYCAGMLAEHLAARKDVTVRLVHRELGLEKIYRP